MGTAVTPIGMNLSIASATAFRVQPTSPASWTRVGSTDVWYATYPAVTEMAARAPDEVYYNSVKYTKVNSLEECSRVGTYWYDAATPRLYLCTGADPSTNVICRMLTRASLVRAFKIRNRTGNTQRINWTVDALTPAAGVGEELQPGEDSAIVPFWGSMYDVQVKAQGADTGKVIDVLVWVE